MRTSKTTALGRAAACKQVHWRETATAGLRGNCEKQLHVGLDIQLSTPPAKYSKKENSDIWTRRRMLSAIAKLFDPLGLISPVVVSAKIIMQEFALLQTEWDAPVPPTLEKKWTDFYGQLSRLSELRISRFAFISGWVNVPLHCFADASEVAYGACLYIRTVNRTGNVRIELLSAKSRVAPLKRLTLPRLKLCAAREAACLHAKVVKSLDLTGCKCTFWSDSTIVLHWLKSPPNTWKTFVANRVQTLSHGYYWQHISGKENPADLVSRGMSVEDFLQSLLWKCGPPWLQSSAEICQSNTRDVNFTDEELETRKLVHTAIVVPEPNALFMMRSSLEPLLRIVAYCIRFTRNCRNVKSRNRSPFITVEEFSTAKLALVKLVQAECFENDLKHLHKHGHVHKRSTLRLLRPFLDKAGIIRVGGRLSYSAQEFTTKHPTILPSVHPFTSMLVDYFHRQTVHGGRQLTLAVMRQEFWPIHGKRVVNTVLQKCHRCFRCNPVPIQQPTGQLPCTRVRPSRPFSIVAPKAYIAVFVCFATKAMHLKIVSDLSTVGFMSAFRRFIGYHGVPSEVHSDNAKNFAGAKHELNELYRILNNESNKIGTELAQQGISWQFIPPRAPNFGGLWEAAVRSVKTPLKQEIGVRQLSHEDFITLLVQISAALNFRPLAPLSDDPLDFDALTPAHFLIGTAMKALPERDLRSIPTNRLAHYQQRQQMFQHYWQRWSKEYICELQTSNKHLQPSPIRIGSIVVLREDNLPPLRWPLARIIEVHPGEKGYNFGRNWDTLEKEYLQERKGLNIREQCKKGLQSIERHADALSDGEICSAEIVARSIGRGEVLRGNHTSYPTSGSLEDVVLYTSSIISFPAKDEDRTVVKEDTNGETEGSQNKTRSTGNSSHQKSSHKPSEALELAKTPIAKAPTKRWRSMDTESPNNSGSAVPSPLTDICCLLKTVANIEAYRNVN
ncbi:uncharacterized protein LOC131695965 [Topomyia yanbarensis]|uniref:uncharacterized protein LOC131695965 n=1 Tax=Topomyia yanbarensis TaxID=2498891 RepID=UPI00273A9334|nr:uncharacterized protein LOC131695965 [Topomyia yanbarensis]